MEKKHTPAPPGIEAGNPQKLELLQRTLSTHTIDLDGLFTRDVSTSGSFDFHEIKNITFGKLLESIPVPTLLVDQSHKIVYANEALTRLENCAEDIVGGSFSQLFPVLAESEKALSALNRIFEIRKNQVFDSILQINKKILFGRITLRSIRFRNIRSVLVIIEDLTAEKKQLIVNEKYHQLVQVFPVGIAEFSLSTGISVSRNVEMVLEAIARAKLVGGNIQFAKMLGHRDIEMVKGSRLDSLFPFAEAFSRFYRAWVNAGFPIRTFETKERLAGTKRYFENTLVGNIKDDNLYSFWTMRQDITVRKESEEALRSARDKLEERVKARTAELQRSNERLLQEVAERERTEMELAKLVGELQEALAKVKTLSGLLPICASCKKIRDDKGYWTQVEVYVRDHSEANFTHSICPDCATKLYPDFYNPGS
ncbi:MAG TPA: PAS domain-containing protein [Desulfomonilaceae bacterium]|nr:PAS domain-containing protein [Desulfomonilaceae bacterium]